MSGLIKETKVGYAAEEGSAMYLDADDELLASLGYASELKREFSYLTVFGQSFGAMGIAPAIAESIVFSLASGGATGMIWTYIAGCILLIPVALSLGELGSAMPTSGGLYFWVAHLCPPWCRAFMTWLAGYMNVLGYISIYASTCYAATLILVAAVSIGTNGGFTSSQYTNYGIFAATVVVTFFMTSVSSKTLNILNTAYIAIQFGMLFALIITLAVCTPSENRNSASFVFSEFQNTGFWLNDGWSFMLCFLTPVWVVSGFESAATIAEEASNAAKAVPFAMISSLVAAAITGWAVIIAIAFTMGSDVLAIIDTDLGQPMAQILLNSLSSTGAVVMLAFLYFSSLCNCSILMVAASRETFAFARDNGLPFSSFLRTLASNKSPARAILFVALFALLEGLLMLINTIAINSIFNLAIMGLYFAYCLPLIARLLFPAFTPGVFYMGSFLSKICATFSVLWMTFIFILLLFPTYPNPNADEMNYAVVVLGFVLVFCIVYYYLPRYGGKHFFTGPVRTVDDLRNEVIEAQVPTHQEEVSSTQDRKGSHGNTSGIEKM